MQAVLPPDIHVSYEFDQSPYVTRAIWGVVSEGALGAVLVGLMILLFLRDWRSAIIVLVEHPAGADGGRGGALAHRADDQPDDPGRTGAGHRHSGGRGDRGDREHPHARWSHAPSIARAVRLGNAQTAVPRLLAMVCILAVFISSFFMQGAPRAMFVPLSLAVGFSMVASYLLSSTFVPVLSVWLLAPRAARRFARPRPRPPAGIAGPSAGDLALGLAAGCLVRAFPPRVRAAAGADRPLPLGARGGVSRRVVWRSSGGWARGWARRSSRPSTPGNSGFASAPRTERDIDRTEQIVLKALEVIQETAGADNVQMTLGYLGTIPSTYPINAVFQWMRGPEDAVMWVALKRESGIDIEQFKEELRGRLAQALPDVQFSFEPADIINEVMSFGSPTPVEVAVSGPDFAETRPYAAKLMDELGKLPGLRDLQIVQSLDYPTIQVDVDRKKAGTVYVTPDDVARSLAEATSSSRFTVPNFWADPEDRHRLPGAGGSAAPGGALAAGDQAARLDRRLGDGSGQAQRRRPGPGSRRGHGFHRNHARRNRPLQHAAPGEHDGEHRRHGPRLRLAGGRRGAEAGGRAAARRQGRGPRADSADARHARRAGPRAGAGHRRDLPPAVGQFPVAAAGAGRRLHGPRGHRRRGADALPDPHDVEHPVVHRRDHGRRRGHGQRDSAGHVRRKPAPARRGCDARRPSRAPASRLRPSS